MNLIWESLLAGLIISLATSLRYLGVSGVYYFFFYHLWPKRVSAHKLNAAMPDRKQINREIKYGLTNQINFFILGALMYWLYKKDMTLIYWDSAQYGYWYLALSLPLLLFVQDTYFYWAHRLLHTKLFYSWAHLPHHLSHNPSPFSAFSVPWMEGFIEVGFRPLIILVMPLHVSTIVGYFVVSFILNVVGHSGYEFFPRFWAHAFPTRYFSSATHHYLHHRYSDCHYGLYFSVWDKIMKTESPQYLAWFDRKSKPLLSFIPPQVLLKLVKLWPPLLLQGIGWKYSRTPRDRIEITYKKGLFGGNSIGSVFGGTQFYGVDFGHVLLLKKALGPHYSVYDQSSRIEYVKPLSRSGFAALEINPDEIEEIKTALKTQRSLERSFETEIKDQAGLTVSKISKNIFIKRHEPSSSSTHALG